MTRLHKIRTRGRLFELLTRPPWWVGLALAALSWLLLHDAAGPPPLAPLTEPARLARLLARDPWQGLAGIGQVVLPFVFITAAAISALRRHRRRALLARVARGGTQALGDLSWRQFELLAGEVFRLQGYRVTETGGGGPDDGVDLVLRRNGEQTLVQCKHWQASAVGVAIVRELYGVVAASGAVGGFVVTSGRFTEAASEFARGLDVQLIDGRRLQTLAALAWAAAQSGNRPEPVLAAAPSAAAALQRGPAETRHCERCTRPMVRRVARSGPNAGRAFWGCTGFPQCRATRPIE